MKHVFYDNTDLAGVEDHELDRALTMLNTYFGESAAKKDIAFEVVRSRKGRAMAVVDKAQVVQDIETLKSTARAVVRNSLAYSR